MAADPAAYGRAALAGRYREREREVVDMLSDLLAKRQQYAARDGERFFDAVQNAHLVTNSERYYRVMYYGLNDSWNLRAVVWAHNSHVGDAAATDMKARGQLNVGELCRGQFGDAAYIVGFGTHTGTVAAARDWDEPMEVVPIRPSFEGSYERVCHDSGVADFLLPLRAADADPRAREGLETPDSSARSASSIARKPSSRATTSGAGCRASSTNTSGSTKARGQLNVGELCRGQFGDAAYIVGFGTHTGTVAAARDWDEPMEVVPIRPSLEGSDERVWHDSGFLLPLRAADADPRAREGLETPGSSARSASSIARKPSSRATTSGPGCRASSTNTSGSTSPAPSRRSRPPSSRECPTPTPSARKPSSRIRLVRRHTRRHAAPDHQARGSARHLPLRPLRRKRKRSSQVAGGCQASGEHHHVDLPVIDPRPGAPAGRIGPEGLDAPPERQVRRQRRDGRHQVALGREQPQPALDPVQADRQAQLTEGQPLVGGQGEDWGARLQARDARARARRARGLCGRGGGDGRRDGVDAGKFAILAAGQPVEISAHVSSRLMLLGGAKMDGPRFIWWNFVSSSKERIERQSGVARGSLRPHSRRDGADPAPRRLTRPANGSATTWLPYIGYEWIEGLGGGPVETHPPFDRPEWRR